jgi:PIN domain nuclease of toxin-antitoxin system
MRLLLDTQVLLWWVTGEPRIGAAAHEAIRNRDNAVFVSAITGFEIETKKKIGKLDAPDVLSDLLSAKGFEELPVTLVHGLEAGRLPLHHKDPFDRILVAQARCEDLTLVTADGMLSKYEVNTLPVN